MKRDYQVGMGARPETRDQTDYVENTNASYIQFHKKIWIEGFKKRILIGVNIKYTIHKLLQNEAIIF